MRGALCRNSSAISAITATAVAADCTTGPPHTFSAMLTVAKREPSAFLLAGQLAALLVYPLLNGGAGRAAFSIVGISLLGLVVRDAESAGIGGLLAVIPLIFTSSTFVPVSTFPGWLQAFATINPITVTVDALRVLCLGGPTATPVTKALVWVGGLLAVSVPAAVHAYRRAATR